MAATFSANNFTRAPRTDGPCPADLAEAVDSNLSKFEERVADDATWLQARVAKDRAGVLVRYRDYDGTRWYRVDLEVTGVTADAMAEALKYEHRQWDPVITTPSYLRCYAHGPSCVDVVCYTTRPQAGGIIQVMHPTLQQQNIAIHPSQLIRSSGSGSCSRG